MSIEVRYFRTLRGEEPVAEYVRQLPDAERAGLRALFELLGEQGFLIPPDGKKIGGIKNLWEIRFKRHRVFYGYKESRAVLLHAFKKQSQKTPVRELETALNRMKLIEGGAL